MFFNRRLLEFLDEVRPRVLLAVVLGLLAVAAGIGRLAFTGVIIAGVFLGDGLGDMVGPLIAIVALTVARGALQYAKDVVSVGTAGAVKVRVRRRLYEHAFALGPGQLDNLRSGDVALSLVDGVERLETFFGRYLPQLAIALLAPVLTFGLMALLDLRTAAVFCVFALLSLFLPSLFERWNRRSSQARREAYAELASEFLDGTQGLVTLKSLGQSEAWRDRLAVKARDLYRRTMSVLAVNLTTTGSSMLCVTAGSAVALGWGATRVVDGALDMRVLVIVLLLGVEVFRPIRDLSRLFHDGMNAMSAAQAIFGFIDTPVEVKDGAGATPSANGTGNGSAPRPAVRFQEVQFAYQQGRRPALHGVSFSVEPGQTVSIAGASGAGKSTLVWLLLRFYDPQHGSITLGDRDLRSLGLEELRRQVAVVGQDTYLFHGSVADNLRFGRTDATQAELEEAARAANAHDFITALPQGYDTIVGERGVRLSGGQRQRIAIARALLKDAPILVLDEALSSVDAESEGLIQEALDRLRQGRTTLVIAHRLSSLIGGDRIIVLDEGRVVEEGRHDELIAAGGAYSRLFSRQQTASREDFIADEPVAAVDGNAARATAPAAVAVQPVEQERLPTPVVLRRLVGLVRPWSGELSLTVVLGILNQASVIALGVVGALLVGRVFTGDPIGPYLVALAVVVPLTALFTWAEMWVAHDLAYRLLAEMRIQLYQKLEPLAPGYLIRRRSGDVSSIMASDVETVELFFAHTITPGIVAFALPLVVLAALAFIAFPVALVLLPFILIVALSPFYGQKLSERLGADVRRELGAVHSHAIDSVQGMREVAAFGRGGARVQEIEEGSERLVATQLGLQKQQSLQMGFTEAVVGVGGFAALITGAWMVGNGDLARNLLPLVTLLAFSAFTPVADIARTARQLVETLASARRIFAVHDEPVLVEDGPGAPALETAPAARFQDVTFAYNRGETPAIRDVSFSIDAGQTVALVGRSGAGKTTCSYLLLRFWDPDGGRIDLDGTDLRRFRLRDLHRQIAWVSQDTYLFNMSLRDNIRLGRPDASDAEVEKAARAANAHDFITRLPDGYETRAGERGVQLSGGQRQRISIARALLMNAPVLVLDEATSHLDAENEEQVREGIRRLMQGRTTVVIAHRLSTIRDAGQILVLDDGRLVEQGRHDELLERDGLYAQLVRKQLVRVPAQRGSAEPSSVS